MRLSWVCGEAKWPAAPDDCEAAARWVAGSPGAIGRSVTSLILAGDSAGGNLAIVTAAIEVRRYGLAFIALAVSLLTLLSMARCWEEAFWKPAPQQAQITQMWNEIKASA